MSSRTWIKIYCDKWLTGTLREETANIRGIWTDILALAGNLTYGDEGQIKLPGGKIGLTDEQISTIFNIPLNEWLIAKERLQETKRIATVDGNIITINNWGKYQSEYSRQAKYRNPKLQPEVTMSGYTEKEIEKEIEKRKDNTKDIYSRVISFLNEKTKASYKVTTKKTRDLIKARLKEGFTLEDFEKVIAKKVLDWGQDPKMSKFLRPETLFGTKFESYLNEPQKEDWRG